jgi:hypothetical protein
MYVGGMGETRNEYIILVRKPHWKKHSLGRQIRWEDNINIELRKVGREGRKRMELVQDRMP